MQVTTRAQREAVKSLYKRGPIFEGSEAASQIVSRRGWRFIQHPEHGWCWEHDVYTVRYRDAADIVIDYNYAKKLTYLQFRRTVKQGWDCLMVQWAGIWIGIERDGYTHS